MTDMKPNAELAYKVLDHIDADPKSWDQGLWVRKTDCGTVACFAGWAVLLSGATVEEFDGEITDGPAELIGLDVPTAADRLLGISPNTLPEGSIDPYDGLLRRGDLGEIVAEIFGPRPAVKA